MRTLGLGGLSVTMPHKACGARRGRRAHRGRRRSRGRELRVPSTATAWSATTPTGRASSTRCVRDEGIDPAGRRCVLLGAGGAGRAVARALGEAGAAEVVVVNRSPGPAERGRRRWPGRRVGSARRPTWPPADLVVNATPLGMAGDRGGRRCRSTRRCSDAGQVVVDLIYHPAGPRSCARPRSRGATTVNGLGMLVHQAAHAFTRWTGRPGPGGGDAGRRRRRTGWSRVIRRSFVTPPSPTSQRV